MVLLDLEKIDICCIAIHALYYYKRWFRKGTGTETKSQIQEVFRIYADEAAGVFSYQDKNRTM